MDPTQVRGVALDVTERKETEVQAAQDRIALQHMARVSLLGQLSASIAHQLNQPLASILGNAEAARMMLDRPDVDLVELRAICDDIVSDDHRAADVIRRLAALFKRGERELRPVDINGLVVDTLDLLRADLVARHVTATANLAEALPTISGERVQLQQVLMNLIVNASDAMSGLPVSNRALMITTRANDGEVALSIGDCGPGIAADNAERIFEPFWSSKPGGMGIGLAVCRSIAAAHGGSLTALNNETGGATFRLILPVERAA
jgi:C4-dicarboxylate-specific signal transduction histidine kinase